MSNAAKVAEIFINAGTAFSKLGEMTMELQKDEAKSCGSGKWTEEEIQLLKESVYKFGQDIEKISQMVRSRTAKQIKEAMKRRNLLISKQNDNQNNPCGEELKENVENSKLEKVASDHEIDVVNDTSLLVQTLNSKKTMF